MIILKEFIIIGLMILYSPLIFLCHLTKYRFLHINSWQIGAYIQTLDTIVKSNLLENKKYKIIYIYPKFLKSNSFFLTFINSI